MLKKLLVALAFAAASLMAGDGYVTTVKAGKNINPKHIEAVYAKHGFKPSENRDMNDPYTKEFGDTGFEIYNLYTYYHPGIAKKLLVKNPLSGIYVPQSMSMWKKKGEDTFHVAFLKASGMAKTLNMDPNDPDLVALEKANIAVLKDAMPGVKFEETKLSAKASDDMPLIARFEMEIDPEDAESGLEEFQEFFEGGLEEKGFAVAGYNDYDQQEFEEAGIKDFAFYKAYSICMLKVIYSVAVHTPEAGMYAPCTLVNYAKKGSDKMVIAHPSVQNWLSALKIHNETINFPKAPEGKNKFNPTKTLIGAQKSMIEAVENAGAESVE